LLLALASFYSFIVDAFFPPFINTTLLPENFQITKWILSIKISIVFWCFSLYHAYLILCNGCVVLLLLTFSFLVNLIPGFDNGSGEWDEYPYVNSGGIEIGSPVRIWPILIL
jgi:hypothetical protein